MSKEKKSLTYKIRYHTTSSHYKIIEIYIAMETHTESIWRVMVIAIGNRSSDFSCWKPEQGCLHFILR